MQNSYSNENGDMLNSSNSLLEKLNLYEQIMDLQPISFHIIDFNWKYIYINKICADLENTTKETLIGQNFKEISLFASNASVLGVIEHCMEHRVPQQTEFEIRRVDGDPKYLDIKILPVDEGIFILSEDVSAQKNNDYKTQKESHLLAFHGQINQNIIRVSDQETLFANACQMARTFGKFDKVWIGIFDFNQHKIDLVEQSGILDEDLHLFHNASYAANGPKAYVLRTGNYFLSNDVENEASLLEWQPFAKRHGIRSCMVLPIKKWGQVIGTFNLYVKELHFWDEQEIDLIVEVANNITFTIERLETYQKQKKAEELIVQNEKRHQNTLDYMMEGIQVHDFNWKYLYVNDALVKVSTYSKEELLGYTLMDKYSGIENTPLFATLQRCMTDRIAERIETEFVFPNGIHAFFELSIQPVPEGLSILSVDITKRKKAEQDLQNSIKELSQYKYALDQSSIVAITDQKGTIRHANDNFCAISGFSREELLGNDHRIINSGYHSDDFIRNLWTTIAHGEIWKGELKNRTKDGSYYWVDTTIVPFLNEKGKPYQYLAIRSDITKRKEAEQDLQNSIKELSQYKYALDQSSIVAITDQKGTIRHANDNFCTISGFSREELLGNDHRIINSGYHSDDFIRSLWTTIAHGEIWKGELKNKAKDGSYYWVDTTIVPFLNDKGKPYQYLAIRSDITKRKETEQELQNSIKELSQYKSALDQSSIVAITDQKGTIRHANDKFCAISGFSREELIGNDHRIINSGYHPDDFIRNLWTTIAHGEIWKGELKNRTKDGSYYWVDTTIVPFLNEKGKPYQYLAIRSDITKRKEAESALLRSNRLFAFISEVNQSIVHVKEQEELLNRACSIAIKIGQFKMAYIGIIDHTNKLNITHFNGDTAARQDILVFSSTDINDPALERTPTGRVLKTGRYAVNNDVQNDPNLSNFRPLLVKHDLASCISLPLKMFGKVVGIMGLHSSARNFFDETEVALLNEAASDISFALEIFENNRKNKATEALVIHNEKRFRGLIEKSVDIKTLSDRNGLLVYGSPSFTKVLGYAAEEYQNKPLESFIHPENRSNFMENRAGISHISEASFSFQYRFQHKQGHWIWCEGTFTNMLHEDGIYAFVSNFQNITDKKLAKEKQEFDRTNLNALINNTNDMMWSIDKDFRLITSNRSFDETVLTISGKTLKKGDNVLSAGLSQEQMLRFQAFYERAFNGETFTVIEHNSDIFEFWTEISFYPLRRDRQIIGTACYSRDITQSKLAEQKIKQSDTFNRGILRSLDAHIAVINQRGSIIAANEAWQRFGVENGETILERVAEGSNYFEVCERSAAEGNEIALKVLKGMREVLLEQKVVFQFEYPCHSPSEKRWFGMRVRKFDSEEPMIVTSHQDISERKLAEEELIHKNEELEKANGELDRFVYSASHDLRSPLTSILGLIQLVEQSGQSKEVLQVVNMIRDSIYRLDGFIKDILNYSKNNRIALEIEEINLSKCVAEAIKSLMQMKDAESIHFEVDIKQETPFFSDVQRINIVLTNLISNAIKFQKPENPLKYIKITGQCSATSATLQILDNGIGIPAAYHEKIFYMFFRLSGSMAGPGIGLYIVRETLEKLKGSIRLVSEENKGSTFLVEIKNLKDNTAN